MSENNRYCTQIKPVSFKFTKYMLPLDFDFNMEYFISQETILFFLKYLTLSIK